MSDVNDINMALCRAVGIEGPENLVRCTLDISAGKLPSITLVRYIYSDLHDGKSGHTATQLRRVVEQFELKAVPKAEPAKAADA